MESNMNGYEPYHGNGYEYNAEQVVQQVMSRTFLYMFGVLLLSGLSAYLTFSTDLLYTIAANRTLFYGLLIGELVIVFAANKVLSNNQTVPAALLLIAYSVVNGMTLSFVFAVYELGSVVNIFVIAALVFGAMAIFGFVSKKDLSSIGSIGMMGLFGIIILGVANIFMKSSSLSLGIAIVGLAVFIGLTAYDTQKIKESASYDSGLSVNTLAMFGALTLYLDFINMFLKLLRLFARRND